MSPSGAPVVLVWGDSEFLVLEASREAFGDARPAEVDAAAWGSGMLADLATPSLLGEARGLLVVGAEGLDDEALVAVTAYAADPAPGARLVLAAFTAPRAKGPPRRLAQAVGRGAEVRRVALDRRELSGWVRDRARHRGVRASPAGAAALVETLGEDPAVLDQAVTQVASAHPAEGLTPTTVAEQFRGFGDRRIWELCDAAFGGDLPAAFRALASMLEAREEPLAVLGGLAARLRELIRVRELPPGLAPGEIARRTGVRFDWQARRYRDQAARFRPEELLRLHASMVEADRSLKQGGTGDVVLPMVVSRIAGAATRGT